MGILGAIVQAVYIITYFSFLFSQLSSTVVPGSNFLLPRSYLIVPSVVVEVIAGVFSLLIFYFARSGFVILRGLKVSGNEGVTGSTILLIFSVIDTLIIVPVFLLLDAVPRPPGVVTANSVQGNFLLPLLLIGLPLLVFAVVGFIGLILLIIGEYRLGSRYQDNYIKIGSILQIIPFLNLIGYFLLYIGFSNAINKSRSGFSPQVQSSMPSQPPAYQIGLDPLLMRAWER